MASTSKSRGESPEKDGTSAEIFPGCSNITEFSQKMLKAVVQATKASNDLPTDDSYDYYSTYNGVRNVLNMEAERLLHLMHRVMRHQNVKGAISGKDHAMELDEQYDIVIDANDQILERVGTSIDEATGAKKKDDVKLVVSALARPNPAVASWNKQTPTGSASTPVQLLTARNIQRPQLKFKDKVNNSNKPFLPIIQYKPNALKSLQESLQLPPGMTEEDTERPDFSYPHPYQYEIELFECLPEQLETPTPQKVDPIGPQCTAAYIDTVADLLELCTYLKTQKIFAVDLEHHGNHSFQGFVCLMQLSTREKDFIVDTLALRSEIHRLNEVFTDPRLTKVFHGADSDILWLQRDFGIYVVNMYDTGQAARVLQEASFSLAHLLDKYCGVAANKQFQMADWRRRPLDDELLRYAQEDTHYLLPLYDLTRRDLVAKDSGSKNLLRSVFYRSKQVSLKVYKKPIFTPDSYKEVYRKASKVFNAQQLYALKAIYEWRDMTARIEDEGKYFVLPDHMLLQMAEILPRERQGVLACCNPIPPLVRQFQHEIHSIILEARELPLTQVEGKKPDEASQLLLLSPVLPWACRQRPHDLSGRCQEADLARPAESVASKPDSALFTERGVLKPCAALSALMTDHDPASLKKSSSDKIWETVFFPICKFIPTKSPAVKEHVLRPSLFGRCEKWRLKAHTLVTGQKRKSSIDLNTFSPQFVPPAKSKPADTSILDSCTITTTTSPSTGGSRQERAGQVEPQQSVTIAKPAASSTVEAVPLSYSELMKLKKKEKKSKKKALLKVGTENKTSAEAPPSPSTPSSTSLEGREQKKDKKKKKRKLVEVPASEEADSGKLKKETKEEVAAEKKPKKKKVPASEEVDSRKLKKETKEEVEVEEKTKKMKVPASEEVDSRKLKKEMKVEVEVEKKTKKKKKKKKVSEESIAEQITPFDYSAADKSTLIGKGQVKIRPEVFNPKFRSGPGKQKKGKKKSLGSSGKKTKSVTYKSKPGKQ